MKTVLDNANVKFYTKCTIRLKFVVESKKSIAIQGVNLRELHTISPNIPHN